MLRRTRRLAGAPRKPFHHIVTSTPKDTPHPEIDVPDDIILVIVKFLSTSEILKFSLASRHLRDLLKSSLYSFIDVQTNLQCRLLFKTFSNQPALTSFIRTLVVRPNRPWTWAGPGSEKALKESEIVSFIDNLASSGGLSRLRVFYWDGLEAPNDELWLTLRTCCPELRNIGTTVGLKTQTINPESHLFSFHGLLGFSLTTQKSLRWSPFFECQELPHRFWEMLLVNSPDLLELTLEGTCQTTQLWNIRRVLSGRWPGLKSISLGSLSSRELPSDDSEMSSFLSAHPTLRNINFLGGMYYSRSSMFYIPSLPWLSTFSGRMQQLRHAPELPSLRHLEFTDWFSPSAHFAELLQSVPRVTSLAVSANFLDSISRPVCFGFYERLLAACPCLLHVEISSTGPIVLMDFSRALRCGRKLQSFVITRTRRLTDEDATIGALRIMNENPTLRHFTIRDVMDWDHHDQLDGKCRFRQIGTYRASMNGHGAVSSLQIHETGVSHLGLRFTRSSVRELRHSR